MQHNASVQKTIRGRGLPRGLGVLLDDHYDIASNIENDNDFGELITWLNKFKKTLVQLMKEETKITKTMKNGSGTHLVIGY